MSSRAASAAIAFAALVGAWYLAPTAATAHQQDTMTWEGTWSARIHYPGGVRSTTMYLNGNNLTFSGTFDWLDGRLTGQVSNVARRRFAGSWAQPASPNPDVQAGGPINYVLAPDGKSFTAVWRHASGSGRWTARCVAGACLNNHEWPLSARLRSARVGISTVSNGCGGGPAGTKRRWLDTNTFGIFRVSFRPACNGHDAGYNGAMVRDPLTRRVIDTFTWSRKRVDVKFHRDMKTLCKRRIPAYLANLRADCFATAGAYYVAVRAAGWNYYVRRPNFSGTWQGSNGMSSRVQQHKKRLVTWVVEESDRIVRFAGTVITRDSRTVVAGTLFTYYSDGRHTRGSATMTWRPGQPLRYIHRGAGEAGPYKRKPRPTSGGSHDAGVIGPYGPGFAPLPSGAFRSSAPGSSPHPGRPHGSPDLAFVTEARMS